MSQEAINYYEKFISIIVRQIYKTKIQIGGAKFIVLVMNYIYITSFSFPSSKQQNFSSSSVFNYINWKEGERIFFVSVRPTQILHFSSYNELNSVIVALITLLMIIIFFGCGFFIFFSSCNSNKSQYFINKILSFSNLFNYYFMMLFTEILLTISIRGGFGEDMTTNKSSDFLRILSTITFILVFLLSLFSISYGEQCITQQEQGLQRNNSNTGIYLIQIMLKIFLVIHSSYDPFFEYSSSFFTQWSCSILYIALSIYELFAEIPFSSFQIQNVLLFSANQSLIIVGLQFLRKQTTLLSDSSSIIFITLSSSLIIQKLIFLSWKKRLDNILFSNISEEHSLNKNDHKLFSRRINMLIVNKEESFDNYSIQTIGVFLRHKQTCQDKHCFCHIKGSKIMKGQQQNHLLLNTKLYDQLIRMYIRNDLRLMNVFEIPEDSFLFLRYMDLFLSVKKHTLALYKIIDILIESEKMKRSLKKRTSLSLAVMLEILKETMSSDIRKGIIDYTVEQTSKAIEIYIQMENSKAYLRKKIIQCLELKQETLERMKKSFDYSQEVEDLNFQFTFLLDSTETQLIDFYHKFTTPLNQLILIFFEAEVKGNLKKANAIKQSHKQSGISEYLNSKNMFIEVFSQEVISITATVGKKLGRIVGFSDKAPAVFGYKKQEFEYVDDIKSLMPATLAKVHDEVVRFMMIRGRYNVVHIARQVFLRNKSNFIFLVSIFADLNFFYAEELPFIFMAKVLKSQSGFLIVDSKGKIEGVCQNFFNKIGQPISELPPVYRVDISYVLPQFEQLSSNLPAFKKRDLNDIEMTFPQIKSQIFNDLFYSKIIILKKFYQTKFFVFFNLENKSASENKDLNFDKTEKMVLLNSIRSQASFAKAKISEKKADIIYFKSDIGIEKRTLPTTNGDLVYFVVEIKSVVMNKEKNDQDIKGSMMSSTFSSKKPKIVAPTMEPEHFSSLNSQENFDDELLEIQASQNHLICPVEQTIAESEKEESSFSSPSIPYQIIAQQQKKQKKKENKKETKNVTQKDKLVTNKINVSVNQKKSEEAINSINVSSCFLNENNLKIQKNITEIDIFSLSKPSETLQSLATSEILGEQRFSNFQETLKGQLLSSNQREENAKQDCYNPQNILIDIKDIQNTLAESFSSEIPKQSGQESKQKKSENNNNNNIQSNLNSSNFKKSQRSRKQSLFENKSLKSIGNDSKSQTKSQKTVKTKLSAYMRFKTQQSKIAMEEAMKTNLSNSDVAEGDAKEMEEKNQLGSSVNGDDNEKTNQINKFSFFEAFSESPLQPRQLKILSFLKIFEYIAMILTTTLISITINNQLQSFVRTTNSINSRVSMFAPQSIFIAAEFLLRKVKENPNFPLRDDLIVVLESQIKSSTQYLVTAMQNCYSQSLINTSFSTELLEIMNPYLLQKQSSQEDYSKTEGRSFMINSLVTNIPMVESITQLVFHQTKMMTQQIDFENLGRIFIYHNYKAFLKNCQIGIGKELSESISEKQSLSIQIIIMSILMLIFSIVIFIVIMINFKFFQQRLIQILNTITTVRTSSVEHEILRVRNILDCLKEGDQIIENYTFSIRQKEYMLTQFQESEENYYQDQRKRKALNIKINSQKLSNIRFYSISSLSLIIFFAFSMISLILNITFLEDYEPALQYLEFFELMSIQAPSILTLSTILFQEQLSNPYFISSQEKVELENSFSQNLEMINSFTFKISSIQKKEFFSNTFISSFSTEMQSNLCGFNTTLNVKTCSSLSEGSLNQGIVNSLSIWKELFIKTQAMEFKNLDSTIFYSNQIDLLQFSIVLTSSFRHLSELISDEVKNRVYIQQSIIFVLALIFALIATVPRMYEIIIEHISIRQRFLVAKKIVFMLPLYTLMIEETFNKMLKAIGNQLKIQR